MTRSAGPIAVPTPSRALVAALAVASCPAFFAPGEPARAAPQPGAEAGGAEQVAVIENPVLPGFHPDPSILRVGDEYYIATSTFQWFGGVRLHRSRDLAHWALIGDALDRVEQLDLRGVEDSGGVWAPQISHLPATTTAHGARLPARFYLVYTVVRNFRGALRDQPNFLVWTDDVAGDWSDPVPLTGTGYDPSLYHDDDGRSYLLWTHIDPRPDTPLFAGIRLQEIRLAADGATLLGEPRTIFSGTELGITEGSHLYKRGGWYYLVTAEGGTFFGHAVTVARSRSIAGPYEVHPDNPIITARDHPGHPLQKTGHASFVRTPGGAWYAAFLAARPVGEERRCILGRETAIERLVWSEDGWPRLAAGGTLPRLRVPSVHRPAPVRPVPASDEFDAAELHPVYQTPRVPPNEDWLSLEERAGVLRLRGRDHLSSRFDVSLVARRVQHLNVRASTRLDFSPTSPHQSAGLVAYYDTRTWYALRLTHDERQGRVLRLDHNDDARWSVLAEPVPIGAWPQVHLRAELRGSTLRFSASPDGERWTPVGPACDATRLSDDYGQGWNHFTGAFLGVFAQDATLHGPPADFHFFACGPVPSAAE